MSSESTNKRSRPFKQRLHLALRWLHVYTSMISFLTLFFFAVSGITLNHPEWVPSGAASSRTYKGKLNPGAIQGEKVDWLKVVEQVRAEHNVRGAAVEMRVDAGEGSFAYRAPGSVSECFFKIPGGDYELRVDASGWIGTMNDLHRGRDAGRIWFWFIDISGYLLVFVSLTGLGILCYLKKSRVAGLALGALGLLLFVWLVMLAIR